VLFSCSRSKVASNWLMKMMFTDFEYDKPVFVTLFNTCMFTLYWIPILIKYRQRWKLFRSAFLSRRVSLSFMSMYVHQHILVLMCYKHPLICFADGSLICLAFAFQHRLCMPLVGCQCYRQSVIETN
jgi:hypothetical protein